MKQNVIVDIDYIQLTGDNNKSIDSIEATCPICKHSEEAYGRTEASIRYACLQLHKNCPNRYDNFYCVEGEKYFTPSDISLQDDYCGGDTPVWLPDEDTPPEKPLDGDESIEVPLI